MNGATALAGAETLLGAAGIDTPRLDAEVLLAHALGTSRGGLLSRLRDPLECCAAARFDALLDRRRRREPVAYVTGEREFWSLALEVGAGVLGPRPETEILVSVALEYLAGVKNPRVLDAGTGSGCIAIALASERRDARITAIDTSDTALAFARRNVARHGLADRIDVRRADLADFEPSARFDLVASNPPYIRRGDIDGLQAEVRLFEPRAALDGGEDGLGAIRRLLARAPDLLAPGGAMTIEIGADQAEATAALASANAFESVTVTNDYAGLPRILRALRRGTRAARSTDSRTTTGDPLRPSV